MASKFLRTEEVAFDRLIEGFDDGLVIAKGADIYNIGSAQEQVNQGDKEWIPAPMISRSSDGFAATFGGVTDLAVPVSTGIHKHVAKSFTAKERRNQYAIDKWFKSGKQTLASEVNMALFRRAALYSSLFSKRTAAATGYDDVADIDTRMTRIGVPTDGRMAFYSSAEMNAMAGNLASRSENTERSRTAYERALVRSDIAGVDVYKNDLNLRLTAATGGATTVNGANQRHVPASTTTAASGETENLDNRGMNLTVTAAAYANIKVGDAFTIANVNEVHMITKEDTGFPKTFRVIGKPSAGVIEIYPAIVCDDGVGPSDAEKEYKNVTATPADTAPLTWLNTTAANMNPFFRKEALLLIPGTFTVDPDEGWNIMTAVTTLGIRLTYARQGDIDDLSSKARLDIDFGTALTNVEMAGVQMFGQA